MKQKLFSIFCCLLLSASMVTQAQLLDAVNDSPEGGYVIDDNGQISGRHNAPQANLSQHFDYGEITQNLVTGATNNDPYTYYLRTNVFVLSAQKSNGDKILLYFSRTTDTMYGSYEHDDSEYDGDGPFPDTYPLYKSTYNTQYGCWVGPADVNAVWVYNTYSSKKTAKYSYFKYNGTEYKLRYGNVIVYENNVGGLFLETDANVKDYNSNNNIYFSLGNRSENTINFDNAVLESNGSALTLSALDASNTAISLKINTAATTGSFSKNNFNLSNTSLKYLGMNATISTISATITDAGSGKRDIVLTIRDTKENVYFVTIHATLGVKLTDDLDYTDNTGSVNSKYFQMEGSNGTYQMQLHVNANSTTGNFTLSNIDTDNSFVKKNGTALVLSSATISVTEVNAGATLIKKLEATFVDNSSVSHKLLADYEVCQSQAAGVAATGSYAAFTFENSNDAILMDEYSCAQWYHGASSTFIRVRGWKKNLTSKNYVQVFFWVDASHRQVYANGVGPKVGTYSLPACEFIVEDDYGYWYKNESYHNNAAIGYLNETDYGFGVAPMSSCGVVKKDDNSPVWAIDETTYAKMNDATVYVEEGLNGNIYIHIEKNGTTLVTFGTASQEVHTIKTFVDGAGTVTLSGDCPYTNGTKVELIPTPDDGYTFDSWSGTDASSITVENSRYYITVNSKDYSVIANFVAASSSCTYEVAFDANGGSGTMPNQEFTCGVAQNLNPNAFTGPAATITYDYHGATSGNGTPSVTVNKPFGVWEAPDEDVDDEAEVNFSASNGETITLIATWNAFPNVTLPTPARTGYTFNGWYTEETGGTKKGNGGASFNPAGSITLHAQWTANTHNVSITAPSNGTITVSYNDGSAQSFTSGSRSIAEGTVLTVTTTPASDYHFSAWTGNGAASVTVDGAKTIGATFAQNDYFLNATYGAGGASVTRNDGGNSSTVKRAGNTVTLTPTAATGYNFLAWAGADAAKMSGNVFTFPTNGTHNTTYNVQATFQANTYQVSFAAGDGSGAAMANQNFTYGVAQNLTANTYTGPAATITYDYNGATGGIGAASETVNATFQNWRKDAVTTYTDGQSVSNLTATNGATVALTAEWEFTYEDATVTLPSPSKTGYTFDHWEYGVAPFFLIADAGEEFTPEEDVTMTAQWNIVTYNLTYEGLEGATNNTNPTTYNVESETITLAAPGARDGYAFIGWTINGTPVTEITHGSTGDKTITANWNEKLSVITLEDNRENSFYNTFKKTYDGATGLVVTYKRQFTQGRWSTLCLPFDVNSAMFSSLNFGSRIYEFKYATGNANDGSGVNLYFSIAKSIKAGKGYIVNADDKLAARTSFEFLGVNIDLSADSVAELNSVEAYDNLTGSGATQGNIELVGTLRKGTLKGTATGNRYMGLKENKIYYPNITTGSTILAYRGIFRSIKGKETLNAERIRIIVDGEEKAELEVINGELQDVQETKKFIENGVLYIERNGIIYDATGRKVE